MKAKRQNVVSEERHKLEEVLPLDFPFSLAIDPCNLCNFECKFCAIQDSKEKLSFQKQFMDLELFKKIIDDISVFSKKLKVLRLSGQGEPLLNPHFAEMVSYAKEKQVAEYIETVTNGSKLNPQLNRELVESGIDRIRISIEEVTEEGYFAMANRKINFKEFIANIKDLHEKSGSSCEIYIKTVDAAVETPEKKELFYNIFEGICDRIWIDQVVPLWSDCADWRRKLVLGDLKKQSFSEIWNGEILKRFWVDMLKGNKNTYEMCAKCVLPMYDCNDNIDEFAQQILERLEK